MTCDSRSMSRPRAATSVATSRSACAVAKAAHDAVALPLLHAAVERFGAVAVRVEHLDERIDLEPRAAEHERRVRILGLEDAFERCRLVRPRHDVGNLADARQLAGGRRFARDREARRILQVPLGNRQDPRRHRRREERRLPFSGRGLEDGVEILGEAHVEHLVGFVQDQHVEPIQLQRAAPDVVERAAGRGDDDVGAALERADLLEHRRAAVEREDRQPAAARVLVHGLGDLHGQLARRHEDEAVGAAPVVGAESARDAVQHRQRERRRLARAGCGLREQVAPLEQQRNRLALDRRRLLVAERRHRRDDGVVEAERGESAGGAIWLSEQCDQACVAGIVLPDHTMDSCHEVTGDNEMRRWRHQEESWWRSPPSLM